MNLNDDNDVSKRIYIEYFEKRLGENGVTLRSASVNTVLFALTLTSTYLMNYNSYNFLRNHIRDNFVYYNHFKQDRVSIYTHEFAIHNKPRNG